MLGYSDLSQSGLRTDVVAGGYAVAHVRTRTFLEVARKAPGPATAGAAAATPTVGLAQPVASAVAPRSQLESGQDLSSRS